MANSETPFCPHAAPCEQTTDIFDLTRENLQVLRDEVAAKLHMMSNLQVSGGVAYVGLHPLVLGKLIDAAEVTLISREEKCNPTPS